MRSARRQPVWKPLRTAIALLVSHDEAFARGIDQRKPSKDLPLQATLPGDLRDALIADGALIETQSGVRGSPWGEQPLVEFLPSETYCGRFDRVLRDFRQQKLGFLDFVVERMVDSGTWLGSWISEGWLTARDSNGELPAALASTLRLDWEHEFEEGPPRLIMVDTVGRRRRDVEVHWPQLLECVRDHFNVTNDAESAGYAPTGAPSLGPDGPVTRPSPVDPLELEAWPLACVLAWVEGAISHYSPQERDELFHKAYKEEARALPVDTMRVSRYLLDFAAAHPDRLKLHHQGGIIEPSQLGPEALIFPTMVGSQLTFALRPHLVIRDASDIGTRVLGIWCLAREVRAAWPDSNAGAVSPEAIEDLTRWKPTWLSLAGAIIWVVTRDVTLAKSTNEQTDNDHSTISGISLRLAQAAQQTEEPVNLHVGLAEAWPAIRRLIADEKIAAEGTPMEFHRTLDGTGIWRTFEGARIPSRPIEKLVLNNGVPGIKPKVALAPNKLGQVVSGYRYWVDVRLKAEDVFREFPPHPDAREFDFAEPDVHEDQHSLPVARPRRGRTKGSGSYEKVDQPLLEEMQRLIDGEKAVSAEDAAKQVASEAHGSGSFEAKVDRLAKRFRAQQRG